MVKLPKSVELLGYVIPVKVGALSDAYAEFDRQTWVITIADNCPDHIKTRALLHEMVHAVLEITGVGQLLNDPVEEAICHAMENLAGHVRFVGPK